MEILFDRSSPLHVAFVGVLFASGAVACWIGIRDGFIRQRVRTNAGVWRGPKAMMVGALYLVAGLAGVLAGVFFMMRTG